MATQTIVQEEPSWTTLRLASGNGTVKRRILSTPLRDALPTEIPVIDISPSFSPSLAERQSVAKQIRAASTTSGFLYIANHGIDASITEAASSASREFFRQDIDTKMQAHTAKSRFYNGYKPPGSQRINKSESIDVRESFSSSYDPRYDPNISDPEAIPEGIRKFFRTEDFQWDETSNLPRFKTSLVAYWTACLSLAKVLVRAFALSLDLPEDYFDSKFRFPDASLLLNYYPPIDLPETGSHASSSSKVSIGSHTDFQLFTILWQDSVGGLQVLNRQGQWIRAAPIPGTLVVNIADYLQRITNDLYVSTVHRAQNLTGDERISMPFFFGFGLHESCGVVTSCISEGEVAKYEEIGCEEWIRRRTLAMKEVESEDEGL